MHHTLSANEAAARIRDGRLSSVDLVKACLARIEETDAALKAWVHLDADYATRQAEEMDQIRQSGRPTGALHGIPVGIKDVIDTSELPTECGSAVCSGRQPSHDAVVVDRLREAGAVILGKTATTEFAFFHAAETRNPCNPDFSPGGSSSGSAAAVAAIQVPLALGTQTNGSVIRPASYCGTFGFKPSRGIISRRGVLRTSEILDHVGVFARTLEDTALLADVISGYDPADPLSYARPRPKMLEGSRSEVPVEPSFAWFDGLFEDQMIDDSRDRLGAVVEALGGQVEVIPAPDSLESLVEAHKTIHEYDLCHNLDADLSRDWRKVSETLRAAVDRGRQTSVAQYDDAKAVMSAAIDYFRLFFNDYDAVISPSAPGEAPEFTSGTGNPVFCTIWTLCGLPSINLPVLVGTQDLPIGVQLIGGAEEDDRLMRTANWVLTQLREYAA